MLDPWIIEEIKKIEEEKKQKQQPPQIHLPLPMPMPEEYETPRRDESSIAFGTI